MAPKLTNLKKTKSTAAKTESTAAKTENDLKAQGNNVQYKLGQQLVYPLQGVGEVVKIEERVFQEKQVLYYIVYLPVSDMTVMIPINKADELGIRSIVSKKQANDALELIGEDYEPITTDWKLRYQMNLDLLKSGTVNDIATVVRALYHRSRVKELPILERKLYDNALTLLVDEIHFSLAIEKKMVEKMIFKKLELKID